MFRLSEERCRGKLQLTEAGKSLVRGDIIHTLFLQIKRQEGSSLSIPVFILSPLFLIFRFYLCNHLPGIFQLPYHSESLMQLDNMIRILKNKCSFVYHTSYYSIMVSWYCCAIANIVVKV